MIKYETILVETDSVFWEEYGHTHTYTSTGIYTVLRQTTLLNLLRALFFFLLRFWHSMIDTFVEMRCSINARAGAVYYKYTHARTRTH